ncbi:extracellular solute-binding protein family 3 [Xylanimonas cellulosilytica DSM 15894]|uniref:Extracellular solute-binding protein family 3 n=1 Tax=Xylanimonas cellulosilytica (strain DSM 15894 / JCM 12276 / CECT 5975 / KCTC 9989 / LMG 20990 / NBRC 107835 / XIL07) TaxID=446471 RepID=D1BTW5_XYLCX|nr:ABC transporter substrate-binding protein [Xylanimonas cellulosilytica]ACZ29129.1 extracellular solute-binding protein family 3 [Xylanimonas cellulosilytica DSM 15894]
MRTRSTLPVALVAVAALALSACSSASQDGDAGATGEAFDLASITKDADIAALVPAAVAEDGKLTVGSDLTYAPAEFVDTDGKTAVGFDIDIIRAVANVLGLELDVQSATFDSIIPAVGTRYEVGVSSFTITPERLDAVSFVSYFDAGSLFAVAEGNPDGIDPENLCGATVSVQTGTIQLDALNAANETCDEPIKLLTFESQADVTSNLVNGRAQAMYADSPVTGYAVLRADGAIELLGEIHDSAPYGIVIPKDDLELGEALRAALQKLMDDGTLAQVAGAWGQAEGVLATAEIKTAAG